TRPARLRRSVRLSRSLVRPLLHRHHHRAPSRARPLPRLRALPRPQVLRPHQAPPSNPSTRSSIFSKRSAIWSPISARQPRSVRLTRSKIRPVLPPAGLVRSITRPGGNITGVGLQNTEYSVKWLELLKEAVPNLQRVALLWNPNNPTVALEIDAMRKA